MQIETLKIFCDLVETRSFSHAAERNFVTQSAVSQQVRGLEARFKRRLLERVRGRRELHLTQAGEAFYEASRDVLAAYGQLEESMRQLSGTVGGRKRLGATDWRGQSFILFERDIPTRRATDRNLRAHGVTIQRAAEFDNIETIKRAVEAGLGVAIVPRPSVLDEQRSGQLAVVPLAEAEWERLVGVVYRSDRALGTAARKFVELLRRHDRAREDGASKRG